MKRTYHLPASYLLISSVLLSACASTGNPTTSTAGNSGVDKETGSGLAEQNVFSDPKELDYTPPQQDYRIGSSDLLDIKVFQAPELSQPVRVDPRGNISLPLVGTIKAEGLSQIELEQRLKQLLGVKYLNDPQVTVFISEFTNQRVTVEGQVKTSGVFPVKGEMSLLQAIALAGGMTDLADPSKTVLFRKKGTALKAYNINLDDIRDGKMRDPYIRNDDRIIVHRSGTRYWLREVGTLLNPVNMLRSF